MKWIVKEKIRSSRMTVTWHILLSDIYQALELVNIRGDEVDNVYSIIDSLQKELWEKVGSNQNRRKGFDVIMRLVENEYIEVINEIDGDYILYFEIKKK